MDHTDLQIGGFKFGLNPNVAPLAVTVLFKLSELSGVLDDDINSQPHCPACKHTRACSSFKVQLNTTCNVR